MIVRINAPSSCKCLSWKVSLAEKRGMGYAKVIHEKKKKKYWKNGQVSEISKTMGTQMPAWKKNREKEMNKIAHVSLQSVF